MAGANLRTGIHSGLAVGIRLEVGGFDLDQRWTCPHFTIDVYMCGNV